MGYQTISIIQQSLSIKSEQLFVIDNWPKVIALSFVCCYIRSSRVTRNITSKSTCIWDHPRVTVTKPLRNVCAEPTEKHVKQPYKYGCQAQCSSVPTKTWSHRPRVSFWLWVVLTLTSRWFFIQARNTSSDAYFAFLGVAAMNMAQL